MSWREIAAPIIRDVIGRVGRQDPKALRKALRDAYPFGDRERWPYKVWCSEIRNQLGVCRRRQAARDPRQLQIGGLDQ